VGTSALAPWASPAPTVTTGLLRLMLITTLTILILIRPMFIRPMVISVSLVSPSVVLLDNHTTNRNMAGSGRMHQLLVGKVITRNIKKMAIMI